MCVRVLVLILSLAVCSGCFVADELDAGREILDQHSPKDAKAKAEPEPEPEPARPAPARAHSDEPGLLGSLLGMAQEQFEPEPPPPDPDDAPVRCWIGKREHFSTRRDCASRGGKPVELN